MFTRSNASRLSESVLFDSYSQLRLAWILRTVSIAWNLLCHRVTICASLGDVLGDFDLVGAAGNIRHCDGGSCVEQKEINVSSLFLVDCAELAP